MVYVYVCVYLHPHVAAMFLQLLPHVLSSQSRSIQHQMLPLDWLEDVGVVRHIQADLHLREAGNEIKRILVDSNSFSYLHTTCPPSSSSLFHPFLPSSGCAGISCRSSRIQPPILPVCGGSVVCPSGPGGGSYPVIRSGRCSRHPAQHGGSSGLKTGS